MNKLWILVGQAYKQKVSSKAFLSISAIYLIVIGVIVYWSEITSLFSDDEKLNIAIVNETNLEVQNIFASNESMEFSFSNENKDDLYKKLEDEKLDAVVELSDEKELLKANIVTYNALKLNDQSTLSSLIEYAGKIYSINHLNLSQQDAEKILNSNTIITETNLNEKVGGKSEEEKESGLWASYIVGIIIYIFVTTYLSMITTDVAAEKGSRTLEMILVNVKPATHFQSKIIGIILLALTQFSIFIAEFFILLFVSGKEEKWDLVKSIINEISVGFIIYAAIFLLLTIVLYLIVGALFGSLVTKVEEGSQALTPAMLTTLIGFYVMISGIFNPDTILITIFSYIPFTSGMVMPMRIGATDILPIEPIISLAVLILTVIVVYWFSLSFYKRSVLTYSSGGIIQKIKSVMKISA